MKSSYRDSLAHIIWECKYHIVFANSTGTFGLIPANERKVIQEYCNKLISYDRMMTPNSQNLFKRIEILDDKRYGEELDKKLKEEVEGVRIKKRAFRNKVF